jgi:nucleotide-binding universal stress UspA family protein
LVVGIVGSEAAREALRWACRLARIAGGEVVVVHALGLLEPVAGEIVVAHRHRADIERRVRDEWCAGLPASQPPPRVVVEEGHPVDVVAQVATAEGADLVVVGTRGVGATRPLALGSTSLQLLQVAAWPVLVVPDPEEAARHLTLRRLLVAVDDLDAATPAVGVAGALAATLDAWVTVVHAVEEVPVFPLGPETAVSSEGEEEAPVRDRRRLEALRQQFLGLGVPADVRVARGLARDVVRRVADMVDADLVVVGSEGAGDPGDPLSGSVGRHIVVAVQRPALVVPDGWVPAQAVAS